MPSTYLYLNPKDRILAQGGKLVWRNLPKISLTSRQCYISIVQFGLTLVALDVDNRFMIKANIPAENYYSSDNEGVVLCSLEPTRVVAQRSVFQLSNESGYAIEIWTNDNYSSLEFTVLGFDGLPFAIGDTDDVDVVLRFDYPEVKEIQNNYVATMPKNLL
jgi:hypothetical protein